MASPVTLSSLGLLRNYFNYICCMLLLSSCLFPATSPTLLVCLSKLSLYFVLPLKMTAEELSKRLAKLSQMLHDPCAVFITGFSSMY